MEDFVVKAIFAFGASIFLFRKSIQTIGTKRFLWAFIAAAPFWSAMVYMGVVMGIVKTYEYAELLQPVILLVYISPVIATWLCGKEV